MLEHSSGRAGISLVLHFNKYSFRMSMLHLHRSLDNNVIYRWCVLSIFVHFIATYGKEEAVVVKDELTVNGTVVLAVVLKVLVLVSDSVLEPVEVSEEVIVALGVVLTVDVTDVAVLVALVQGVLDLLVVIDDVPVLETVRTGLVDAEVDTVFDTVVVADVVMLTPTLVDTVELAVEDFDVVTVEVPDQDTELVTELVSVEVSVERADELAVVLDVLVPDVVRVDEPVVVIDEVNDVTALVEADVEPLVVNELISHPLKWPATKARAASLSVAAVPSQVCPILMNPSTLQVIRSGWTRPKDTVSIKRFRLGKDMSHVGDKSICSLPHLK